jgi:serine/threonine protein kinase
MRFGPFEIVRPLGRGGMAETFLALWSGHEGFRREICLKRVLAERAAEPDFVKGFQREAKLAARLVHPHIAQVYDFGCEGETWWMALEHVPGGDLRALLKALEQPMPLDLGLVLMVDMLEALAYAHDLGIVHRDVSPSNILVDLQGNFKLADFGIAKVKHVDRDGTTAYSTTTGTIKGKAAYMAPEQALGHEVDGRADLWSFGVVMFEAFAKAKPFEGPTDLAIMMAASQGRRARLIDVAPHVPPDVCEVIEKLVEPNRDLRFQSAGDVLEALVNRPAPVQGRRRIAAMIQAVGAGSASVPPGPRTSTERDEAPPTRLSPADASPVESMAAPPSAAAPPTVAVIPASTSPTGPLSAPASIPAQVSRGPLARAVPLLALALVAGAVTAFVIVWSGVLERDAPSTPTASVTTPPATIAAIPPPATRAPEPPRGVLVPDLAELPPVPEPVATSGRTPTKAPSREAPVRPPEAAVERGSLHVTVIPWGDVRVDGQSVGRSPVTVPLVPGAHRVQIESESGSVVREVRIAPGRREELEVDLSDG